MRKLDELALWSAVRESRRTGFMVPVWPDLSGMLGIPDKRADGLLHKWVAKGWWEYGVSARCGWFTDAAPEFLPA